MKKFFNSIELSKFFIVPSILCFALLLCGLVEKTFAQSTKQQASDCTRSTPERIVKRAVFSKTTFKLSRDRLTGTETVTFPNGDKLTITNGGCEYYYLGFRFETGRFSARPNNTKYWFAQAVKLIEQTQKGIDAPVQIADAIKALKKYIKSTAKPALGEEIDYGGADIRTFVAVNKIQALSKGRYALELSFAVGPL